MRGGSTRGGNLRNGTVSMSLSERFFRLQKQINEENRNRMRNNRKEKNQRWRQRKSNIFPRGPPKSIHDRLTVAGSPVNTFRTNKMQSSTSRSTMRKVPATLLTKPIRKRYMRQFRNSRLKRFPRFKATSATIKQKPLNSADRTVARSARLSTARRGFWRRRGIKNRRSFTGSGKKQQQTPSKEYLDMKLDEYMKNSH